MFFEVLELFPAVFFARKDF